MRESHLGPSNKRVPLIHYRRPSGSLPQRAHRRCCLRPLRLGPVGAHLEVACLGTVFLGGAAAGACPFRGNRPQRPSWGWIPSTPTLGSCSDCRPSSFLTSLVFLGSSFPLQLTVRLPGWRLLSQGRVAVPSYRVAAPPVRVLHVSRGPRRALPPPTSVSHRVGLISRTTTSRARSVYLSYASCSQSRESS